MMGHFVIPSILWAVLILLCAQKRGRDSENHRLKFRQADKHDILDFNYLIMHALELQRTARLAGSKCSPPERGLLDAGWWLSQHWTDSCWGGVG